ncbi:MAG TPA: c-type cytochrome [Bryobacteraceae bacterium]|nr:c-type cytochrome [Bryobacteraceae bacterium]
MFRRLILLTAGMCYLAGAQTPAEEGRQFYLGHCAHCHGPDGEGGRGVNLTTGRFRHSSNDDELLATIRTGLPGTEMPGSRLPPADLRKLVIYVRQLGEAGAAEKATGDAAQGERIYSRSGCSQCHAIGTSGGGLGPPLDSVGRRRSLKFLQDSLTSPSAYNPKEFVGVRVVTVTGEVRTGVRLNEDDYSIQLRDQQDRLWSFSKQELREVTRLEQSLMPSYQSLSTRDLADLVAYLNTLRRAE